MSDSPLNGVGTGGIIPPFPEKPVLLVDGDIVAYRAAAAAEKVKYLVTFHGSYSECDNAKEAKAEAARSPADSYVWSRKEIQPESFAIQCMESIMLAIDIRFPGAETKVFLSGERNFRDIIWRTKKYKGNRTAERPKHLAAVRQALLSRWTTVVSENQEADDDIGIANRLGETVVASTDKDLDQIAGWHYNFVDEELYWVSPADAEAYFWEQVISGDATDNIPGLPGWGPKTARKWLDANPPSTWEDGKDILTLFISEGFDFEYLKEMMELIYIKQPE